MSSTIISFHGGYFNYDSTTAIITICNNSIKNNIESCKFTFKKITLKIS